MRIMLTLIDREEISRGLAEDLLFAEIAVRIGRDPSVVSRDVARHGGRAVRKVVLPAQRLFLSLGAGRMRWDESRSSGSPPL